jgi:hypothetical protein
VNNVINVKGAHGGKIMMPGINFFRINRDFTKNPIVRHSIEFSIMVIKYVELLEINKKYIIAKQLLRSATSIAASVMEAQSAESKSRLCT